MGDAATQIFLFMHAASPHEHLDGDNGFGVVFLNDDSQTIVQSRVQHGGWRTSNGG
jgi:hypothetical protein